MKHVYLDGGALPGDPPDRRATRYQAWEPSGLKADLGQVCGAPRDVGLDRRRRRGGDPGKPKSGKSVSVTITTEDPENNKQAVFFNRGVAGSQAYSRLFGKHRKWYKEEPQEEDPAHPAYQ